MRKTKPRGAFAALLSALILVGGGCAAAETSGGLIEPAEAKALMAANAKTVLLDVRTAEEFAAGHIAGAKLLPYDAIDASSASGSIPSKDVPVIVYCRSGRRSAIAAKTLRDLGYRTVWDLGAIGAWPYGTVK